MSNIHWNLVIHSPRCEYYDCDNCAISLQDATSRKKCIKNTWDLSVLSFIISWYSSIISKLKVFYFKNLFYYIR